MRIMIALAAGLLALSTTAGTGLAMDMPAGVDSSTTAIGEVLVNDKGMTLYTFDEDSSGASVCYGKCAENWPPLAASADAASVGDFTAIARDDGMAQWAYKGKPLYLWVRDKAPGDTTGDGARGWHAARP